MTLRILTLILCFLLSGCPAVDLQELDFTRKKPEIQDLVGVWVPTKETAKEILERGRYPSANTYLELRDDNTFVIHEMPDWWSDSAGESHGKFESRSGTWTLKEDENVWTIWRISLRTEDSGSSVTVYRQKAPYQLFFRLGDPNEGDAMFFERKPSSINK